MNLWTWAARWGIPAAAVKDLEELAGAGAEPGEPSAATGEAGVLNEVRLEASGLGARLFRNNVGAMQDPRTGRVVRYGLANESAAMNRKTKSSDLIGLRPVTIQPHHVGHVIGQFVARETKTPGWRYTGSDREVAQLNFINLINAMGGDAAFAAGPGSFQP